MMESNMIKVDKETTEKLARKVREVKKTQLAKKKRVKRITSVKKRCVSKEKSEVVSKESGGNVTFKKNNERRNVHSSGVIVDTKKAIYSIPTMPKVSHFKIPKKVTLSKDPSATPTSQRTKQHSPQNLLCSPTLSKDVKRENETSNAQNANKSILLKDTTDEHLQSNCQGTTTNAMEYVEKWVNASFRSDTVEELPTQRCSEFNIFDLNNSKNEQICPMVIDGEEVDESVEKIDQHVSSGYQKNNFETSQCQETVNPAAIYIVVDTNVLAHNLMLVEDLKRTWDGEDGSATVIILIPWIVFQELDSLKDDKSEKNPSLKTLAANAVKYLHDLLFINDPQVKGQTIEESSQDVNWSIKCNDDSILQCCLQCKTKGFQVLLLTNDCNLRNKAIVNNIRAHSYETITAAINKISPLSSEKRKLKDIAWEGDPNTENDLCDGILQDLKRILHSILEIVVKAEIYAVYGPDMWLKIVVVKPPWRLMDVLTCLREHWVAVFGHVVDRKAKDYLETVISKFKLFQGSFKKEDLKVLLFSSLQFLTFFNGRPTYKDRLISSIHKIRSLLDTLKTDVLKNHQAKQPVQETKDFHLLTSNSMGKNNVTSPVREVCQLAFLRDGESACVEEQLQINEEDMQTTVLGIFQEIWAYIHQACGMIYDSFNMINPVHYDRPDVIPTPGDSLQFIPRFFPLLTKLKTLTQSVLQLPPEAGPDSDAYEKLCFHMTYFFSYLNVGDHEHVEEVISPEMLYRFCKNPKTREMLQSGLRQLEGLHISLYKCVLAIKDFNQSL